MTPNHPERHTPTYLRHGTTTLFAALDVATGKVIGSCHQKHRAKEFIKFLEKINKEFPKEMEVHVVLDNYATHGTEQVLAWRKRHPDSISTSHPLIPRGSIKLSVRSGYCLNVRSSEVRIAARVRSERLSLISSMPTTRSRSHSSGAKQPTKSSQVSAATASEPSSARICSFYLSASGSRHPHRPGAEIPSSTTPLSRQGGAGGQGTPPRTPRAGWGRDWQSSFIPNLIFSSEPIDWPLVRIACQCELPRL